MHTRLFSRHKAFLHLFLLLSTFYTLFLALTPMSHAAALTVPDQYASIQAAIDAAASGDTILVNRRIGETQSTYYERIVVNKQLSIIGEGRDFIIIDGNGAGTVVTIQADAVEFKGFTVVNGGQKYSGIRVNSYSYAVIADNAVRNNKQGLVLLNSLEDTVVSNTFFNNSLNGIALSQSLSNNISNNDVTQSAYGIRLTASNTTFVVGNTLTNNSYGIYMDHSWNNTVDQNSLLKNQVDGIFPPYSSNILIKNNQVSESAYGIELYQSEATTVLYNTVTDNSYGIYLAYSSLSNIIENNTVKSNDWGITLYSSSSNTIRGNKLSLNTYGVYPSESSNYNQIYHNNLIDNSEQAYWNPYVTNTWDNGYPSGGNYWSDYTGSDGNGDGIGDTSYNIDPTNRDRYPLMNPWGVVHDVAVTDVVPSLISAYVGNMVHINVTAGNEGTETETFDVTVRYENATLEIFGTIETQTVSDLDPGGTTTLTFDWNTSDVQPCVYYTIIAEATTVIGEIDTADNVYVDGTVKVKMPGDVNGDRIINISDLTIVSVAYGSLSDEPNYDIEADINKDGIVDMRDLFIVARNLGKTC